MLSWCHLHCTMQPCLIFWTLLRDPVCPLTFVGCRRLNITVAFHLSVASNLVANTTAIHFLDFFDRQSQVRVTLDMKHDVISGLYLSHSLVMQQKICFYRCVIFFVAVIFIVINIRFKLNKLHLTQGQPLTMLSGLSVPAKQRDSMSQYTVEMSIWRGGREPHHKLRIVYRIDQANETLLIMRGAGEIRYEPVECRANQPGKALRPRKIWSPPYPATSHGLSKKYQWISSSLIFDFIQSYIHGLISASENLGQSHVK